MEEKDDSGGQKGLVPKEHVEPYVTNRYEALGTTPESQQLTAHHSQVRYSVGSLPYGESQTYASTSPVFHEAVCVCVSERDRQTDRQIDKQTKSDRGRGRNREIKP